MFRCDKCEKNISAQMLKLVTDRRDKTYYYEVIKRVRGEKIVEVKSSEGWEIVKELELCEKCYEELSNEK